MRRFRLYKRVPGNYSPPMYDSTRTYVDIPNQGYEQLLSEGRCTVAVQPPAADLPFEEWGDSSAAAAVTVEIKKYVALYEGPYSNRNLVGVCEE